MKPCQVIDFDKRKKSSKRFHCHMMTGVLFTDQSVNYLLVCLISVSIVCSLILVIHHISLCNSKTTQRIHINLVLFFSCFRALFYDVEIFENFALFGDQFYDWKFGALFLQLLRRWNSQERFFIFSWEPITYFNKIPLLRLKLQAFF